MAETFGSTARTQPAETFGSILNTDVVGGAADGMTATRHRFVSGSGRSDRRAAAPAAAAPARERMVRQRRRSSVDMEFHTVPKQGLADTLRAVYDPEGVIDKDTEYFADKDLMQRESLQWDPAIRAALDRIWQRFDVDGNHRIDKEEYVVMHREMFHALMAGPDAGGEAGADTVPGNEELRELAIDDFVRDAGSAESDGLDKGQFQRLWFGLADAFTSDLSVGEYVRFLDGTLARMLANAEAQKPPAPAPAPAPALLKAKPKGKGKGRSRRRSSATGGEMLQWGLDRKKKPCWARSSWRAAPTRVPDKIDPVEMAMSAAREAAEREGHSTLMQPTAAPAAPVPPALASLAEDDGEQDDEGEDNGEGEQGKGEQGSGEQDVATRGAMSPSSSAAKQRATIAAVTAGAAAEAGQVAGAVVSQLPVPDAAAGGRAADTAEAGAHTGTLEASTAPDLVAAANVRRRAKEAEGAAGSARRPLHHARRPAGAPDDSSRDGDGAGGGADAVGGNGGHDSGCTGLPVAASQLWCGTLRATNKRDAHRVWTGTQKVLRGHLAAAGEGQGQGQGQSPVHPLLLICSTRTRDELMLMKARAAPPRPEEAPHPPHFDNVFTMATAATATTAAAQPSKAWQQWLQRNVDASASADAGAGDAAARPGSSDAENTVNAADVVAADGGRVQTHTLELPELGSGGGLGKSASSLAAARRAAAAEAAETTAATTAAAARIELTLTLPQQPVADAREPFLAGSVGRPGGVGGSFPLEARDGQGNGTVLAAAAAS
eukprot:g6791.t1